MSFSLKPGEAMEDGVRRLILRAIDRALAALHDPAADPHRTVHGVRRRCNEVRALLRLVRGSLDPDLYRTETARFRDLRRRLGGARDRAATLEAFDRLYAAAPPETDRALILPLRHALAAQRDHAAAGEARPDLARAAEVLTQARDSLGGMTLRAEGFSAIAEGLTDSYRRGRRALAAARGTHAAEAFHEWRKDVKHHRQHLRVLRPLWPALMKPLAREAAQLAAWLGDEHDLAVLAQVLATDSPGFDKPAVRAAQDLITARRGHLQTDALALGRRFYADRPKVFCRRIAAWAEAWADDPNPVRKRKRKPAARKAA